MIRFNKPTYVGSELQCIQQAIESEELTGDSHFSRVCEELLENLTGTSKAVLTPSCTAALELAALLIDIQPGDEVILPSYTFVSTANAFVLRGAKLKFVDIRADTLNINEDLIEAAITDRTKAIVPVHYAGVGCEMDSIMAIADRYSLYVIEDAAQGISASYLGRPLGSIGHLGAISFHGTKNITSGGEGGVLLVNSSKFSDRAMILREKGTNRHSFHQGNVDKYTWVDVGSSFLPGELQAAYLAAQLDVLDQVQKHRMKLWDRYYLALSPLQDSGKIELANIPEQCSHNAHMFYLKCRDLQERSDLIKHLRSCGVSAVFHYVPLHSSEAGEKWGKLIGEDVYTTRESERLVRLPLYFNLSETDVDKVIDAVKGYYDTHK